MLVVGRVNQGSLLVELATATRADNASALVGALDGLDPVDLVIVVIHAGGVVAALVDALAEVTGVPGEEYLRQMGLDAAENAEGLARLAENYRLERTRRGNDGGR